MEPAGTSHGACPCFSFGPSKPVTCSQEHIAPEASSKGGTVRTFGIEEEFFLIHPRHRVSCCSRSQCGREDLGHHGRRKLQPDRDVGLPSRNRHTNMLRGGWKRGGSCVGTAGSWPALVWKGASCLRARRDSTASCRTLRGRKERALPPNPTVRPRNQRASICFRAPHPRGDTRSRGGRRSAVGPRSYRVGSMTLQPLSLG